MKSNLQKVNGRKVVHLVPSLKTGGAEWMLFKLTSQAPIEHIVYYFDEGPITEKLQVAGVETVQLRGFRDFYHTVKAKKYDVTVVAWLYKSCLIAALTKILLPRTKVFFNHRNSLGPSNTSKLSRKATLFLIRYASKFVEGVIFNSYCGANTYAAHKIKASNEVVLQNGFDLDTYKPSFQSRERMRDKLNVDSEDVLYIVSARHSPEKQLDLIVQSFLSFSEPYSNVKLVVCGRGTERLSLSYKSEQLVLIGEVSSVSEYYQMCDYGVLYSQTEGFPNVIGEAMACGLPCIVSDVGDCALLAGETGWVCTQGTGKELIKAFESSFMLGKDEYQVRSTRSSEIIRNNYSIEAVCDKFSQFIEG